MPTGEEMDDAQDFISENMTHHLQNVDRNDCSIVLRKGVIDLYYGDILLRHATYVPNSLIRPNFRMQYFFEQKVPFFTCSILYNAAMLHSPIVEAMGYFAWYIYPRQRICL